MSQALARYLRPTTLEEYKGNEAIKTNLLSNLSLPDESRFQSLLLGGQAGNGKTTLARLVAKSYLCIDKKEGELSCNKCKSCLDFNDFIKTGNDENILALREINCADKNGVDDMAELIAEATAPSFVRGWRVYICDEVHLLSKASQGFLLKFLEESPPNILFIFCTTDADKLLDTLLSRMNLTYTVNLEKKIIKEILVDICRERGVTFQSKALDLINTRSGGILRKALNNLDSLLKVNSHITVDMVSELFGDVNSKLMRDLFRAYLEANTTKYIQILNDLETQYNMEKVSDAILYTLKLGISIKNGVLVDDVTDTDLDNFQDIFGAYTSAELLNLFKLVLHTKRDNVCLALLQAILEKAEAEQERLRNEDTTGLNGVSAMELFKKEEEGLKRDYKEVEEQKLKEKQLQQLNSLTDIIDIDMD